MADRTASSHACKAYEFGAYSTLWQTVSKESGLATLSSVIHGYADLPRDVDCMRRARTVSQTE